MKKSFKRLSAVILSLAMAVTLIQLFPASVKAAASDDYSATPGNYSFYDDYCLGWNGSVAAYKNGRQVSFQEAGVKTYGRQTDNPFEAQISQSWYEPNLTLSMPIKFWANGKANEVESMLTNFDFIADPTAIDNSDVDGKIYVYGTTEGFSWNGDGTMKDNGYANHSLTILSSTDMVNWTDEGFMDTRNLTNLKESASGKVSTPFNGGGNTWAPSGLKIDGDGDGDDEYYLFYTNGGTTGYVMSDSPTGPWKDPLQGSLCHGNLPNCGDCSVCFDPGVLADDKGNAYVYFGGLSRTSGRVVKIKFAPGTGAVSLDGDPRRLATHAFFEDNEINQFNGKYYYSYCSDWNQQITNGMSICVYVSSDPMDICFEPNSGNPYQSFTQNGVYHHFLGTILENPSVIYGQTYNNHHHMQEFKGKYYIFYHSTVLNNNLQRSSHQYRNLHVDEITVDPDTDKIEGVATDSRGNKTVATYHGAEQVGNYDPYRNFDGSEKFINATTTSYSAGVKSTRDDDMVENSNNGSPMVLDCIDTGDWTKLEGVDLESGPLSFSSTLKSNTDKGAIEVFIDDPTNPDNMVATLRLENTSGYKTLTTDIDASKANGVHDVYFVFRGSGYTVASWKFGLEEFVKPADPTPVPQQAAPVQQQQPTQQQTVVAAPTEKIVGGISYDINSDGTLTVKGPADKNVKSVNIPYSENINGRVYHVSAISDGAFSGCTDLLRVIIGKNVKKIGKKAFAGCSKLKNITVKSTKLKSVGKQALKGTAAKLKIKVPKKKYKAYKKLFKGKGQSKKAKVTK